MRIRLPQRHRPDSSPERLYFPLVLSATLYLLVGRGVGALLGFRIDGTYAWFDFQIYLAFSYALFLFSRSFKVQSLIQAALTLVFVWINLEKLYRAGDYLRLSDFSVAGEFLELAGAEHLTLAAAGIAFALTLLLGAFAWNAKLPERVDLLALIPILSVLAVFHAAPTRTFKTALRAQPVQFANILRAAGKDIQTRGLFLNFIVESTQDTRALEPVPEAELTAAIAKIEALKAAEPSAAERAPASKERPNVYIISHESFWNPTLLVDSIPQEMSLSPEYVALWKKNGTQYAMSPSYGGYTANYEFEVLCGLPAQLMDKSVHFQELAAKAPSCLPRVLSEAGYQTVAFHPGDSGYYNRQIVYRALGFGEERFEDGFDQRNRFGKSVEGGPFEGFLSDQELFRASLDRIDRLLAKKTPFLFYTMTLSGHTPFYFPRDRLERRIRTAPKVQGVTEDKVLDALNLNWYESKWLAEFIGEIHRRDPSAIVVAAGDHQPGYSRRILDRASKPVQASYEKFYEVPLLAYRGKDSPPFPADRPVSAYELPSWILRSAGVVEGSAKRFQWFRAPASLSIRPVGNGTLVARAGSEPQLCSSGLESAECRTANEWSDPVKVLLRDLWYGESRFPSLVSGRRSTPAR